ncbi:MAG: hypothetical protein KDK33_19915, partial [Leptospiraceae bacterium]|nr:hypothetical protein [Leptospiraceae bacterium]
MFRDIFRIVCLLLLPTIFACSQGGSDPYGFLLDGRNETYLPIYSLAGKNNSGAAIEASLTQLILFSKSTVYCSFYDVTSPGVLDALLLKKAGGVDVRIGLSGRAAQSTGYEALSGALTTTGRDRQLWISDSSGENDLNLCVGDKTRIWLSTVPPMPDRLAGEAAYSAYIQSGEDDVARKFSTELDLVTHGSFGPNKQKLDRRNYWLISDASIGVYFDPAENTIT